MTSRLLPEHIESAKLRTLRFIDLLRVKPMKHICSREQAENWDLIKLFSWEEHFKMQMKTKTRNFLKKRLKSCLKKASWDSLTMTRTKNKVSKRTT